MFFGLDNAGKTTLMRMLADGRLKSYPPTFHSTKDEIKIGGIHITAIDVGGHKEARKHWESYFPALDAVVFMVDSNDPERFLEVLKYNIQ